MCRLDLPNLRRGRRGRGGGRAGGLELARSTGNPGSISQALGALAIGLAPTEPEQSRSYIAESLALNDALGTAVVDENALSMVLMASAVLGDRDDALMQCARALRHGLSLVVAMCACLEATADDARR